MTEDYQSFFKEPREDLPRGKGNPILRRKPINAKSNNQALKDAKWEGIKEAFLFLMTKFDPDGPHCESCGIKGNARTLDLNHIRRRGQGGEYAARNAELLCNRFNIHGEKNCHARADGNDLRWSRDD